MPGAAAPFLEIANQHQVGLLLTNQEYFCEDLHGRKMADRAYIARTMFARLLILFITIPVVELYLFMTIGSRIGIFHTFGIILITGVLGAGLTKLQGMRTLARYQQAMSEGRLPHEEVMDGLMILVAGAVLLTPGFLTDAVGFSLLIPAVRAVLKRWLGQYLKGKIQVMGDGVNVERGPNETPFPKVGRNRSQEDVIIEAEVVEESVKEDE